MTENRLQVAELVNASYAGLGTVKSVTDLGGGVNDSYHVRTTLHEFVLRIYRAGWRNLKEVSAELEAIGHLVGAGIAASTPLTRDDGRMVAETPSTEGRRCIAAFTVAHGTPPRLDSATSRRFGALAGALHSAGAGLGPSLREPLRP